MYIPELGLIIELDGNQHFRKIEAWSHSGIPATKRDVYKMRCANQNGIRVVRLLQQDVWDNDESWLDANLKPLLVKKDARENEYIGVMYAEHKRLMAEGTEIDPSEFYDEEE
jgi:very-short-patch-repair endonuclease